jgi:hypothetical protein
MVLICILIRLPKYEFIQAVLNGPKPDSEIYIKFVDDLDPERSIDFSVILDEDRITSIMKSAIKSTSITIKRSEIGEIIECRSYLKVLSKRPKRKTLLVPDYVEGYDEIKRKLQGWVAHWAFLFGGSHGADGDTPTKPASV